MIKVYLIICNDIDKFIEAKDYEGIANVDVLRMEIFVFSKQTEKELFLKGFEIFAPDHYHEYQFVTEQEYKAVQEAR